MRSGTQYRISKLDNANLGHKVALRRRALRRLMELGIEPFVLEAYAGLGRLWSACYRDFDGVAIEKLEEKCYGIAAMRPRWAVYQADTPPAIEQGILGNFPINFVDIDCYGSPWPAYEAFFRWLGKTESGPGAPPRLDLVCTDGGGLYTRFTGVWQLERFQPYVQKYGAARMFEMYPEVCREMVEATAAPLGYELKDWVAFRVGRDKSMMIFWAGLEC